MQYENLLLAGEALKEREEIATYTSGCSMLPLFRQHKDIVVISRPSGRRKKGDVVLYANKDGSAYILHRIVKIRNGNYIIRGDNNCFTEYGITDADIVGVLKEFYREGKYCNPKKSFKYKLYTFYIYYSYPFRFLWRKKILPFLSKVKHKIIK